MKSKSSAMTIYTFVFFLINVAPSLQVRFSVIGLDLPLVIHPGEDAVLPCHLSPKINAQNMTIRWFKEKYQNIVHLYQDRGFRIENQMAEYRSRTTLIKDSIVVGSVSLIIRNVQPSDSGLYTCFYNTGSFYEEAVIEVKVAALGSKPHIYLEDLQNGGIAVVCESSGWYPEPEAKWEDDNMNNISSSIEVKALDSRLQFHVKATYIFSGHPFTLSCCIRNPILSQWKQSTVHITDAFLQRISSCISNRLLISAFFTVPGILLSLMAVRLVNKQRALREELDWRRAQRFAAAVTLDPDTAHPWLVLSEDGRSVRDGDRAQDLPDTPQRFNPVVNVLGRERLSSGRHYWEVEVGGKTRWTLGVCDEAVSRKERISLSPENGYWTLWHRDGEYKALTNPPTLLTPRAPLRAVGLFLDYEAGRLSLYNVDDRSLLFTFSGASFPPTLRPYFCPCINKGGRNAGALRILPVTGRE
ncbi:butyrophilin subfamily 1 member A1-like isoform X2 [Pleurodeles waltl]|uniref:butyrophilin subfamily 1 member A1-like isoform X2 n=1 Tax=Pleurodeles waltl TaxID=8319 RepID=UPI00370956C9